MASKREAMQQRLRDQLAKQTKAKEETEKTDASNTAVSSANSKAKAKAKGKGKEKSKAKTQDNNTAITSPSSVAVVDPLFFEKRMAIAQAAIKAVGEMIYLGAYNRSEEEFKKINDFLTGNQQLAWYPFLQDDITTGRKRDPKEIKEGIIASIKTLISSGKNIKEHNVEPRLFKTNIAFILWSMFSVEHMKKGGLRSSNKIEYIREALEQNSVLRLFKIANCGQSSDLVFEYLFKEHGRNNLIFPFHRLSISKPGIAGHDVIEVGEFPSDKPEYSLKEILANNKFRNLIVIDAWEKKAFRIQDWNTEGPVEYRDNANDIRFKMIRSFPSPAAYKLARSLNKSVDLGITSEEVDNWVEELYKVCTGFYENAPQVVYHDAVSDFMYQFMSNPVMSQNNLQRIADNANNQSYVTATGWEFTGKPMLKAFLLGNPSETKPDPASKPKNKDDSNTAAATEPAKAAYSAASAVAKK